MFWMNMLTREVQLGRLLGRHAARRREEHRREQPHAADDEPHRGGQLVLVHVQRAFQITPLPIAWDITAPVGPRFGRLCERTVRHRRHPVRRGLHLLSKQAGYDPANPTATNNSLSTYASNRSGRSSTVRGSDPLRRLGRRDHGPELELLGPVKRPSSSSRSCPTRPTTQSSTHSSAASSTSATCRSRT